MTRRTPVLRWTVLVTALSLLGAARPHHRTGASGRPAYADAVRRLDQDLQTFLSTYRWRSAHWSVLVVSLDTGDTLFARAPDSLQAPASNLKLLTTAAALERLGPDYRFRTYLLTDGTVRDGVLDGNLIVYGTGDPGISDRFYNSKTEVFDELVSQLTALGVHTVTGSLVADASYLPGPLRPRGWDPRDLNDYFTAPVSALSFNENVVSFRVEAGPRAGVPPIVQTIPDHSGLDIQNDALTVRGAAIPRLAIVRAHPTDPVELEGRMRVGSRDVWRQMTVPDPAAFTLSVFRSVLEANGIEVRGGDRLVENPAASLVSGRRIVAPAVRPHAPRVRILATHVSPPLLQYLAEINRHSNNFFAESVFRTLGRVELGDGSPEGSARAVSSALQALGVRTDRIVQLDGCGLSSGNRVSASILVSVLTHMASSPMWDDFWSTLPEAGRRGGLSRMYHTAAAGNLRAKTGTLKRVSALSGMVRSSDGERLVFSIIVNGTPSTSRAKWVENRIGARLASFGRGFEPARSAVTVQAAPRSPDEDSATLRHRVRRGESFSVIARHYGLTVDELLRANPHIEPRHLIAGHWITIPQG